MQDRKLLNIIAVVLFLFAIAAAGAERLVLLEYFTNAG